MESRLNGLEETPTGLRIEDAARRLLEVRSAMPTYACVERRSPLLFVASWQLEARDREVLERLASRSQRAGGAAVYAGPKGAGASEATPLISLSSWRLHAGRSLEARSGEPLASAFERYLDAKLSAQPR